LLKIGFFRQVREQKIEKKNPAVRLDVCFEFRHKEREFFLENNKNKKYSAFVGGRKDQGSAG